MSAPGTVDADQQEAIRERVAAAITGGDQGEHDLTGALDRDPDAYLQLLVAVREGALQTGRMLHETVAAARAAGHSWGTIGEILGVSRQAAQQRFGGEDEASRPQPVGEERVLAPLTAFNEMAVLEQAGREGWHVVRFGAFHHVVQASEHQWEHRRRPLAVGPLRSKLLAEGWQPVGSWFPWQYLKRPLPTPADPPGNPPLPLLGGS